MQTLVRGLELKIPPPVQWLVFTAIATGLAYGLPQYNFPFAGQRVLAFLLAIAGAASGLAGLLQFRRARTTFDPHHPEHATCLVQGGIYRLTRNPMYLGLALALLGVVTWWASAPGLLCVAAFCVCITWLQILPEERILDRAFGMLYRDYRQRVRRWI